jgi:Metallo-peptidase family M12/Secretion system C-terminal sorting domain
MKRLLPFVVSVLLWADANAGSILWKDAAPAERTSLGAFDIVTKNSRVLQLDLNEMKSQLMNAPAERSGKTATQIELPLPDGTFELFAVTESPIMEAPLAAKYPGIKTYLLQGITHATASGRMDVTYLGFHAMILNDDATFFIDPVNRNTTSFYQVYYKSDAVNVNKPLSCGFDGDTPENIARAAEIQDDVQRNGGQNQVQRSIAGTLRTYRLAIACTGEYAAYFGGTKPATFSAEVTSINRVNGVYEREVDVRMIMIGNTDTLIFLNANTDPYDNNDGAAMLGQNQSTVNAYIGSANYDFGHVFSTGGGGIAGLGVICGSSKAQGVTGSPAPVGDPFDIDYVAHEMGHQFGGNHTFNGNTGSCSGNRNANTAYEPGSGTTIMAYAGICSPQDVAAHSDAFFHTASFDEIVNYITLSTGNNCPVTSATGNNAPVINSIGTNVSIPISTPFMLTGDASDPDGDTITYCWEQYDLGPAGAPSTPSGNAPLFRSQAPLLSPTRIFPKINYIISNNANPLGEKLPTYARSMKFRLTVRDNKAGGGGVTYENTPLTISVINTTTPFLVTNPNVILTWPALSQQNVTWDVSGTDQAPISATNVDILLSTDGGFTYPLTLANAVPNNGAYTVTMPNLTTNTARIMVKPVNNIFFDISNKNFIISAAQGLSDNAIENQSVSVYPNPTEGVFTFSWAGNYKGDVQVMITDVTGRMVAKKQLYKSEAGLIESFDLSKFGKGIYTLVAQTPEGNAVRKVVIE